MAPDLHGHRSTGDLVGAGVVRAGAPVGVAPWSDGGSTDVPGPGHVKVPADASRLVPDEEPESVPTWVRAIHVEQDRAAGLALLLSTVPGVEHVSPVRPGVALAALLDSTDLGRVGDGDLVEVVAAWQRMQSWVHAQGARAAAELAGRASMNPSWDPAAGHPPTQECVAGDELAMRLSWSRRSAARLVQHGQAFASTLTATGHALATGMISPVVAGKIVDRLADQHVQVALDAEERVLADAGNRTPTQIDRDLGKALLIVDPHDAAHRAERARARRCVHRPRVLPDGMASLTAVLPAVTAARIDATLDAAARTARSVGDPRTLDQLRADGLSDLVLHTTCTGLASGGAAWGGAASGGAAPGGAASGGAATGDAAIDGAEGFGAAAGSTVDPDARSSGRAGFGTEGCVDGPGTDDRMDASTTDGTTDGSENIGRTGCGTAAHHRTEVRVTVALSTLLGLDEQPADLAGIGAVDASTARSLALAEGGVWRRIVTDPLSGTVLDVGRATYRPPRGLARHVRARDQVCARPGCSALAETCDLDHTIEFHDPPDGHAPGTTAHDNLGPLCRRDHRLKTDGGFRLRQTVPGTYVWTTPAGHQHHVVPGQEGHHRHLGTALPPGSAPGAEAEPSPPPPF